MQSHTLIIGYGNADRQDDGVGWHIVKNIAERLGESVPSDPGEAIEVKTETADLLFDLQLYPELSETISHYDRVCFVDAHTSDIPEPISWVELDAEYEKSPLTHHMSPKTVLSITATVYNRHPEAVLLSVRGYNFQFERELSEGTAALAEEATERLWEWINR